MTINKKRKKKEKGIGCKLTTLENDTYYIQNPRDPAIIYYMRLKRKGNNIYVNEYKAITKNDKKKVEEIVVKKGTKKQRIKKQELLGNSNYNMGFPLSVRQIYH